MSFTDVFGGQTILPSQPSYQALALSAATELQWPLEALPSATLPVVTSIIDVTPSAGSLTIKMPNAEEAATGTAVTFNNVGGFTFTVIDQGGNTLLSVASGTIWQLYLRDNSTVNGSWRSYQQGASVSQAQASSLAGFGMTAIGAVLSQSQPVSAFNANFTAGAPDRASLFVWTGTGAGTLTLPAASDVGDGWYICVRNEGGGDLTVDPQGSETINGDANVVLQPGDSAFVTTDGSNFYTIGLGQQSIFAFDYTTVSVAGTGVYTLSGTELNRIAYKFQGILTGDRSIVMPTTTQQYWVDNSTTGGSYLLKIGTLGQTPFLTVPRGSRGIYYCNGQDIVKADTASIATPIAVADGGTGATTANGALINLGISSFGLALFTAASEAAARAAILAAGSGANSDITSLSGLTTPLSVAQGGTGRASLTASSLLMGAGTSAVDYAVAGVDYAGLASANVFSKKQTLNGGAAELALLLKNAAEDGTITASAATGTINLNLLSQAIQYYTTDASGNWTINLRGDGTHSLDSLLSAGDVATFVFMATQGATPYYNSAVQVDGTPVTPKWAGGAPTAGTANGIDVYTYAVVKTAAATFKVLASVVSYT